MEGVGTFIDIIDYVYGIGNMMTSPIDSNTFHGGTTGAIRVALALWASTRVCVGAVASERRRNHRCMIEECYQQLSMASAAVWQRF